MAYSYEVVGYDHDNSEFPILFFHELDEQRWETRKVEVFRTGRQAWASAEDAQGGADLSQTEIPPFDEIAADPQFIIRQLTCREFEDVWLARFENFVFEQAQNLPLKLGSSSPL